MKTGFGFRFNVLGLLRLILWAGGVFSCAENARAGKVEIIAHRGRCNLYPENTCASFRACVDKADRVEFDVRTSADGELVIIHDDTVNRTTTGYGAITNVADLTLAELKALDAGAKFSIAYVNERIPTFAEALRSLPPGHPPMVDCLAASPTGIVNTLQAEGFSTNAMVLSGSWDKLLAIHKLDPAIALCAGGSGALPTNTLGMLKRNGILNVSWYKLDVTPEVVDRVHAYDMTISVYTPSNAEIQAYLNMGVDGILCDQSGLAYQMAHDAPASNQQLAQDLVAYWKLDDGLANATTTSLEDVEGTSTTLWPAANATPAWLADIEARLNGALAFDGQDDYVLIPSNSVLDIGANAMSISLWVKLAALPSALPKGYACIYDDRDIDAYTFYLDRTARELRFKTTDINLSAARPGIPQTQLQTGVWHHVVGVYDGSASPAAGLALIYLDGVLQDMHVGSDFPVTRFGLTNLVRKGQYAALGRNGKENEYFFQGALDDIAIWRRALSPAEIRQIYQAGTNNVPLERLVMTIQISNFQVVPESNDLEFALLINHASMTNQSLHLRTAGGPNSTYSDCALLSGGHGHRPNFHIPASAMSRKPGSARNPANRGFFQIVCP